MVTLAKQKLDFWIKCPCLPDIIMAWCCIQVMKPKEYTVQNLLDITVIKIYNNIFVI